MCTRSGHTHAVSDPSLRLIELCRELRRLAGVTGTWMLSPSDQEADLYVTVNGFDEVGFLDQMRVYRAVEEYKQDVRSDMDARNFVFNYSVQTDDDTIGDPLIPAGAKQLS